jgi:hypothetical protein
MNEEYILFSSLSVFQEVAMARTRRATASSKPEDRAFWISAASIASLAVLVGAAFFLLKILAPSWLVVLGAGVGGTGLLAAWPAVKGILVSKPLSPFLDELFKRASGALRKPVVTLGLSLLAVIVAPLTSWYWQASARTPILLLVPGDDLATYLEDGEHAVKLPEKTFEVRMAVREKRGQERFRPRDEDAVYVGAGESVLRWRTAGAPEEKDGPKWRYVGTARFSAGETVTIDVVCRKPETVLIESAVIIKDKALTIVTLTPEDHDDFVQKVDTCEPLDTP